MFGGKRRYFLLLAPIAMAYSYKYTSSQWDLAIATVSLVGAALQYDMLHALDEKGLSPDETKEMAKAELENLRSSGPGMLKLAFMTCWAFAFLLGAYNISQFLPEGNWDMLVLAVLHLAFALLILVNIVAPEPVYADE